MDISCQKSIIFPVTHLLKSVKTADFKNIVTAPEYWGKSNQDIRTLTFLLIVINLLLIQFMLM